MWTKLVWKSKKNHDTLVYKVCIIHEILLHDYKLEVCETDRMILIALIDKPNLTSTFINF